MDPVSTDEPAPSSGRGGEGKAAGGGGGVTEWAALKAHCSADGSCCQCHCQLRADRTWVLSSRRRGARVTPAADSLTPAADP